MLIYCAVVFGIIYLFMIRPTKRRMAEYQKMIDSLQVGNRVLAGGIYGTIKSINEKSIELEIAKGVVVHVNKNAVAGVEEQGVLCYVEKIGNYFCCIVWGAVGGANNGAGCGEIFSVVDSTDKFGTGFKGWCPIVIRG